MSRFLHGYTHFTLFISVFSLCKLFRLKLCRHNIFFLFSKTVNNASQTSLRLFYLFLFMIHWHGFYCNASFNLRLKGKVENNSSTNETSIFLNYECYHMKGISIIGQRLISPCFLFERLFCRICRKYNDIMDFLEQSGMSNFWRNSVITKVPKI